MGGEGWEFRWEGIEEEGEGYGGLNLMGLRERILVCPLRCRTHVVLSPRPPNNI